MDYADCFPDDGMFPKTVPVATEEHGFEKLRQADYLTDYGVYVCPSAVTAKGTGTLAIDHIDAVATTSCQTDYAYAYGMMEGSSDRFGNADSALSTDRLDGVNNSGSANHSDYGNVLFLDGHVKGYPTDAWLTNSGIDQHLEPNQVNPS